MKRVIIFLFVGLLLIATVYPLWVKGYVYVNPTPYFPVTADSIHSAFSDAGQQDTITGLYGYEFSGRNFSTDDCEVIFYHIDSTSIINYNIIDTTMFWAKTHMFPQHSFHVDTLGNIQIKFRSLSLNNTRVFYQITYYGFQLN